MPHSTGQNTEILRTTLEVIRGDRYASRPMRIFTSGELALDRDMQELIGGMRGADGRFPTRGFQRVLYGEAFPWRALARYFVAARKAGVPLHQSLTILARFDRFLCDLYDARATTNKAA
jgi:hypothetical protein